MRRFEQFLYTVMKFRLLYNNWFCCNYKFLFCYNAHFAIDFHESIMKVESVSQYSWRLWRTVKSAHVILILYFRASGERVENLTTRFHDYFKMWSFDE